MRVVTVLVLAMIAGAQIAWAEDDPLAPARNGKIQCFNANLETKTCASISRYEWMADGSLIEEDEASDRNDPTISLKIREPAKIEEGKVCQTISAEAFEHLKISREGMPLPEADQENLRQAWLSQASGLIGKRICMEFSPYGGEFTVFYSADGEPLPQAQTSSRWVDPGEGYVLAR